jgi:hypothetical protein
MNTGSNRVSETKVAALVNDVILADDFDREHLMGFSVKKNLRELDADESGKKIAFPDDWIETSVTIDIPIRSKEEGPRPYTIPGFHYRPLIEVLRAAFADAQAAAFHLFPFKHIWKDPLTIMKREFTTNSTRLTPGWRLRIVSTNCRRNLAVR